MGRMFDLVRETWNPVCGCLHDCVYCWARGLAEGKLKDTPRYCNGFKPQLIRKELDKVHKLGGLVFVSSMGDLFGEWVPTEWIRQVLLCCAVAEDTEFLLVTKNPKRMLEFKIPGNCVVGCTVESDRDYGVSKADAPLKRLAALQKVQAKRKMVSVEPILDFDLEIFANAILTVNPEFVYVGYGNYYDFGKLQEPTLAKTRQLGEQLGLARVRWKVLREPIHHACFPIAT
jgi:DNA repair photolyase